MMLPLVTLVRVLWNVSMTSSVSWFIVEAILRVPASYFVHRCQFVAHVILIGIYGLCRLCSYCLDDNLERTLATTHLHGPDL